MIYILRAAVLPDLICPPGSARLGTVASMLDKISEALVQAASILWPGEAEAIDLAQRIARMPEAAQCLMDLQEAATTQ